MLLDSNSTYIPTNRKTHGVINVTCAELRNCTRQWQPGSHFSQRLHLADTISFVRGGPSPYGKTDHGKNGYTSEGIAQQKTQRSRLGECFSDPQKETGADGSSKSDELNMARFQSNMITVSPGEPIRISSLHTHE